MTGDAKKVLRCAIYTRKSTEERLDMEFNSLDAQREACEAFILSQRHEGWKVLGKAYDDGGFSGGNLDRPALKQLLSDIRAKKVDIVVVYKVDRLTRSLSDFSKIVETFDAAGVAFVSVTQQFNTTTSMGRLTLNVLLSFAQFEREVTGERIRDKIAASRRKGMWMGGTVPLGYDLKDQRYVINPTEADQVRQIFRTYIEQRCVRKLATELVRIGIRTKVRVLKSGKTIGGNTYSRGPLYYLLNNRTYLGEAVHKGKTYPGQHEPIIDMATWDRARAIVRDNRVDRTTAVNAANPSLLAGLVYDDLGNRLSPTHTNKRGVRHRYYVAQPLLKNLPEKVGAIRRVPALQLEGIVRARIEALLANPKDHLTELLGEGAEPSQTQRLVVAMNKHKAKLATASTVEWRRFLLDVTRRIVVGPETITIKLDPGALRSRLGVGRPGDEVCSGRTSPQSADAQDALSLEITARVKRSGRETKLLIGEFAYRAAAEHQDPMLIKTIARAHAWNRDFLAGRSTTEIAREAKVHRGFVAAVLPLAYLAPDMTEAILDGRQPLELTAKKLLQGLPASWVAQQQEFIGQK